MQLLGSYYEAIAQSSVHHHADDFQVHAAITSSPPTRKTLPTVHIGLDATVIANLDIRNTIANFQHFNAQFMTGYPGKVEERKLAQVTAHIGSANAHSVRSN
jgi:hypothetical protein